MFEWYKKSAVCYALLVDVDYPTQDYLKSRWWSRAWTLQELLAPKRLRFFDKNHTMFGSKESEAYEIQKAIGIDKSILRGSLPQGTRQFSVAQRMSWASRRVATRTEDIAYSLLGIFEVNMPLLYGEGEKAFRRLQREILQREHDQTLFAYSFHPDTNRNDSIGTCDGSILATHPADFADSGKIVMRDSHGLDTEIREFDGGHQVEMYIFSCEANASDDKHCVGLLPCGHPSYPEFFIGIVLLQERRSFSRAANGTLLVHQSEAFSAEKSTIHIRRRIFKGLHRSPLSNLLNPSLDVLVIHSHPEYTFHGYSPPDWVYSEDQKYIISPGKDLSPGRLLVLGFYNKRCAQHVALILRWTAYSARTYFQFVQNRVTEKDRLQGKMASILRELRYSCHPKIAETSMIGTETFSVQVESKEIFDRIVRAVSISVIHQASSG